MSQVSNYTDDEEARKQKKYLSLHKFKFVQVLKQMNTGDKNAKQSGAKGGKFKFVDSGETSGEQVMDSEEEDKLERKQFLSLHKAKFVDVLKQMNGTRSGGGDGLERETEKLVAHKPIKKPDNQGFKFAQSSSQSEERRTRLNDRRAKLIDLLRAQQTQICGNQSNQMEDKTPPKKVAPMDETLEEIEEHCHQQQATEETIMVTPLHSFDVTPHEMLKVDDICQRFENHFKKTSEAKKTVPVVTNLSSGMPHTKYQIVKNKLERKYQEHLGMQKTISLGLNEYHQVLNTKSARNQDRMAILYHGSVIEANKQILVAVESQKLIERELEKLHNYVSIRSLCDEVLPPSLASPSLITRRSLTLSRGGMSALLPYDEKSNATLSIRRVSLTCSSLPLSNIDHFVVCLVEHKSNLMVSDVQSLNSNRKCLQARRLDLNVNILVSDLKPDFEVKLKLFVMSHKISLDKQSRTSKLMRHITSFLKRVKLSAMTKTNVRKVAMQSFQITNVQYLDLDNVKPYITRFQLLGEHCFNRTNCDESRIVLEHFDCLTPFEETILVDAEQAYVFRPKSLLHSKPIYCVKIDKDYQSFDAKISIDRQFLIISKLLSHEHKIDDRFVPSSKACFDLRDCLNPIASSIGTVFESLLFTDLDGVFKSVCLVFSGKTHRLDLTSVLLTSNSIDHVRSLWEMISARLNALRQWISPAEMIKDHEQLYWQCFDSLKSSKLSHQF